MVDRIFHHYKRWEDWKCGLYTKRVIEQSKVKLSSALLANTVLFMDVSRLVISDWKYASETSLTDTSRNRRAWLGQAACCYNHGASEDETKTAWHTLTEHQQAAANSVAEEVIVTFVVTISDNYPLFGMAEDLACLR